MKFDLDLQGVPEIQKIIQDLPRNMRAQVLREALTKGAEPILQRTKDYLIAHVRRTGVRTDPVIRGMRIGRLRRRRKGSISVTVQTPSRARLGIAKEAKWYYPAHIELGTSDTTAKPFMRPALQAERQHATDLIRNALFEGLEDLITRAMAKRRVRTR